MTRQSGAVLALALLAAGCTAVAPLRPAVGTQAERACEHWFRALDRAVEAAGVGDAQYSRVDGYPYLRVDRLHASLRDRAGRGEAAEQALAEAMRRLDVDARGHEIANLPASAFAALPGMEAADAAGPGRALRRTEDCGAQWLARDSATAAGREAMLERARVPDDYSTAARLAGLYALTSLPFALGIERWENGVRARFSSTLREHDDAKRILRYSPRPPQGARRSSRQAVARLLARAARDPLGRPILSPAELERVAHAYAPRLDTVVKGEHDRFGALRWGRDGRTPEVDTKAPTLYFQQAHSLYGEPDASGRVLLQLVYTAWFPERPAQGLADLLAGRLDALVWRVTLAPDGEPLLYDAMHACGCYHQFFPTPRAVARPAPEAFEEWALVPRRLPRIAENQRMAVRLDGRTHYIEDVKPVLDEDSTVRYALRPYGELRSLARPEGGSRSLFGPDGLVAGTERAERILFWPMGIRSAGAMRQWGRHATAFVGRRHFDDADLIERRFVLALDAD